MNERKTKGRCMSMCPEKEIKLRERENLLHPFEVAASHHGRGYRRADWTRCVKAYSRPTVGKQDVDVEDIRPADVLANTANYLIDRVCNLTAKWSDIYDFVFDRLRAARQDLVIQEAEGAETIYILELAIRFHIYSDYRLCTAHPSVFDQRINDQHTQECLKRLINSYNNCPGQTMDHRPEFEATYLLFNLGERDALKHYYSLSQELRYDEAVHCAYMMSCAYLNNNWVRVYKLLSTLVSPIHVCAVHRHFSTIRWKTLHAMNTAYSSKNAKYPLSKLTEMLWLNYDSDTQELCERLGIRVVNESVQFQKTSFNMEAKIERSHCDIITDKLNQITAPDILHGCSGEDLSLEFSRKCKT